MSQAFASGRLSLFRSLMLAALMVAVSIGSLVWRPFDRPMAPPAAIDLALVVPRQFGPWRAEPELQVQVVNPQTQQMLDRIYSQILARSYVNDESGARIMLSIAYGSDQRGDLQAHKPEVCYPAQGFVLRSNRAEELQVAGGVIPVRRLQTALGPRQEPVTYWFTMGDQAVRTAFERRLAVLKSMLTGRIPDGLLFRVSSIDPDASRAFSLQDDFVRQLLTAIGPAERQRLSGLAP